MSLRLHLLGTPYIEKDGQRIELASSKAIALLAILSVIEHPLPRERILSLLWPESTDESGRKNLRNTLWSIRRTLDDDIIISDGDQLRLNESMWTDVRLLLHVDVQPVVESERFVNSLVSGVLLDGLNVNDAPDYELWLSGERERLGQLYLRAISRQLERYRNTMDWEGVITTAHRALEYDHLQEPIHRYLIEAYARLGQRGDALHAFELLRSVLMDELGVEPLPETIALKEVILSGELDQVLETRMDTVQSSPRMRRVPILGGAPRAPYIGRIQEKNELDIAYQKARDGESHIVLISGEMGIGKSRLWLEWSTSLPADITVLEAKCLESTRTLPFAPLIELLGSRGCLRHLAEAPSAVPPIWLAEVARVVPAIRSTIADLPLSSSLPFDEERRRLFEAFAQFLSAVKGQPIILFIDDIHWIDQTLLDWLDFYIHRKTDHGLLLVLAYRHEDASTSVARTIAGWNRDNVLQRIELKRLNENEATTLVESLGGAPELARRAHALSAGNPYFLIELCRGGNVDVPPALSELIRSRLNRLPEASRQVLQAASILKPNFDFVTLRRVSGRGEEETLDALDSILDAAVMVEKSGLYAFSHPLVAEVVQDGLSSARRSFLHRRAAEVIESLYTTSRVEVAAELLLHYAAAGEYVRAAYYADIAARRALDLAAPAEAIEFHKQALTLSPTPQRQIEYGKTLQQSNELAVARAAFESAYHDFVKMGDLQSAGRVCLNLAELSLAIGRVDQVLHWVTIGLGYLKVEEDPAAHALAHFLLAAGRSQGGSAFAEAETHLKEKEAVEIARENDFPDLAARSKFEMGNLLAQRGDLAGALDAYHDSMSYAERATDTMQVILAHNNIAYHALLMGQISKAHTHIERAIDLADAAAILMPRQYLYSTRGEIALVEGQWNDAEKWFDRGLAVAEKAGNSMQVANYIANLALVSKGRKDYDTALVLLEKARLTAQALPASYLLTQIDIWLAELHFLRGESTAVEQTIKRIDERPTTNEYHRLRGQAEHIRLLLKSK